MEEDGGGRKRREERRRVSHIPGLMHGAIDSGSLPEHWPRFKESTEGGMRGRSEGRTAFPRGLQRLVCVCAGGGECVIQSVVCIR